MANHFARLALAAGLFCLAGSIVYLTVEVSNVRRELPGLLSQLERAAAQIQPVVEQVEAVRSDLPYVLVEIADIRDTVDSAVDEIAAVRATVPPILEESSALRATLPQLQAEVSASRATVDAVIAESERLRALTPDVLNSVDATSRAIQNAASEVQATRPLVGEAIAEVRAVRQSVDPALDRVDELIDKANTAGKEISESAVTRAVTGVFTSPFRLFGAMFDGADKWEVTGTQNFTESERATLKAALVSLDPDDIGAEKEWSEPGTGMTGVLSLLTRFDRGDATCRTLRNQAWRRGELVTDKKFTLCRNAAGAWILQKS